MCRYHFRELKTINPTENLVSSHTTIYKSLRDIKRRQGEALVMLSRKVFANCTAHSLEKVLISMLRSSRILTFRLNSTTPQ